MRWRFITLRCLSSFFDLNLFYIILTVRRKLISRLRIYILFRGTICGPFIILIEVASCMLFKIISLLILEAVCIVTFLQGNCRFFLKFKIYTCGLDSFLSRGLQRFLNLNRVFDTVLCLSIISLIQRFYKPQITRVLILICSLWVIILMFFLE